jgi:hypothetical protein
VKLCVQIRRFFCDNPTCLCRIFTERVPEISPPHVHKTGRMTNTLQHIGLICGGEAVARLADRLGIVRWAVSYFSRSDKTNPAQNFVGAVTACGLVVCQIIICRLGATAGLTSSAGTRVDEPPVALTNQRMTEL